jgi:predicted metallopeptidase
MKKTLLFLSFLLFAGLVSFLVISNGNEDTQFNEIPLSEENSVVVGEFPVFYDTIMRVGLDAVGVKGVTVIFGKLTDAAKDQYGEGELKAHVRYFNGIFYLFTDVMKKNEAMNVLAHEIAHIQQYNSGTFVYENDQVYWHGELYSLDNVDYDVRPWEREAFSRESEIENAISKVIIE